MINLRHYTSNEIKPEHRGAFNLAVFLNVKSTPNRIRIAHSTNESPYLIRDEEEEMVARYDGLNHQSIAKAHFFLNNNRRDNACSLLNNLRETFLISPDASVAIAKEEEYNPRGNSD